MIWTLLRIALGTLFIVASYYKIMSPGAFAHQIYNYKILPTVLINPMAMTLPWLQFFCGLALLINRWTLSAAGLIAGMLFIFQAALGSALVRGLNVSCGCFKAGGSAATWLTFSRDTGLLLVTLLLLWHLFKKQKVESH